MGCESSPGPPLRRRPAAGVASGSLERARARFAVSLPRARSHFGPGRSISSHDRDRKRPHSGAQVDLGFGRQAPLQEDHYHDLLGEIEENRIRASLADVEAGRVGFASPQDLMAEITDDGDLADRTD